MDPKLRTEQQVAQDVGTNRWRVRLAAAELGIKPKRIPVIFAKQYTLKQVEQIRKALDGRRIRKRKPKREEES